MGTMELLTNDIILHSRQIRCLECGKKHKLGELKIKERQTTRANVYEYICSCGKLIISLVISAWLYVEESKTGTYIDDGSGKLHSHYKPNLGDYDGMMVEKFDEFSFMWKGIEINLKKEDNRLKITINPDEKLKRTEITRAMQPPYYVTVEYSTKGEAVSSHEFIHGFPPR